MVTTALAICQLFTYPNIQGSLYVAAAAEAADTTSGTCGTGVTWSLDETTGTLTISGSGKMADYSDTDHAPWYEKTITHITIENGVTSIGKFAFYGCTKLTDITIPDTVTSIGESAFKSTGLTRITIPDSITEIGASAFYNCSKLASVTLPTNDSFTTINTNTFYGCKVLNDITIPNSVTRIGGNAFSRCTSLTSIIIPYSVTSIGSGAFNSCSKLASVTLPTNDNFTTIPSQMFNGCQSLESITIPNSVTKIQQWAFQSTGLTEITIPNTVTSIESDAFSICSKLANVTLPTNDSFKTISSHMFSNCASLKEITIPGNITKIGDMAFEYAGLTSITIPDSVTSIGSHAFFKCSSLTSITIPDTVTVIASYMFSGCSKLASITIPNTVTAIGQNAFENCTALTDITVPDTVKNINMNAFSGCGKLASVTLPTNKNFTTINGSTFSGCTVLTGIEIPSSVTKIGKSAFENCTALTDITVPDNVASIEQSAFSGCKSLTTVEFKGATVPTFGNNVFINCTALNAVTVPCGWDKNNLDPALSGYAINQPNHIYGKVWTSDENTHWHICSNCNDKAKEAAHIWNNDADATSDPITYTCTVCSSTKTVTAHTHTVCSDKDCSDSAHDKVVWTPWESDNSLPTAPGNYYLTKDVTVSSEKQISGELSLCLNGHTVTMTGLDQSIYAVQSGILNLSDCQTTNGTLTGVKSTSSNAAVRVGAGATFNMYGGTISGNTGTSYSAGVYIANTSSDAGTFNMYGGTISGNTTTSQEVGSYGGGGVYISSGDSSSGTFNMYGGTISGNTAKFGSGVYVSGNGKFNMSGGTISDNTASCGGGVYVASYSSDRAGTFNLSGGTISDNTASSNGGGVFVSTSGKFTMSGNSKISGNTASNDNGGGVYIYSGSTFTMNSGTISGNKAKGGGGGVYSYGSFTMNDGEISGNESSSSGGGISSVSGTINMNGGTISNNTASRYGGGIYYSSADGVFKMEDGSTISGNKSSSGGGVYVSAGKMFTMTGGTISENTSTGNGGGVYSQGTFKMNGGSISGNKAEGNGLNSSGGGVYFGGANSVFEMTDGSISENTSTGNGGGVNAYGIAGSTSSSTFTMSGGTISGNTSSSNGGGIYVYGVTFTINGKVDITGNPGSNVFLSGSKTISIGNSFNQASRVGVTTYKTPDATTPVAITDNTANVDLSNSFSDIFSSDNEAYQAVYEDDNVKLTVKPKDIAEGVTITLDSDSYAYTGSAVEPAVTVTDGTKTLVKDTDYTVEYSNNINTGTATVTITGINNYTGTVTKNFTIEYQTLPSNTSLEDYVTITTPGVDGADDLYGSDITIEQKDGWTVGLSPDDFGDVTITEETGPDGKTIPIYIKAPDGTIYKTQFFYKLDKTDPTVDLNDITVETGSKLDNQIIGKKDMIINIPASDITDSVSGVAEVSYTATPDGGGTAKSGTLTPNGDNYEIALSEIATDGEFVGTIELTVTDSAGHTTTVTVPADGGKIIVEEHKPTVEATTPDSSKPNDNGWYNENFEITVTVTDNKDSNDADILSGGIATIEWKDGENGEVHTVTVPTEGGIVGTQEFTIPTSDGEHTYYVNVVDNAGNESGWQEYAAVRVDTEKPDFTGELTVTDKTKEGANISFTPTEDVKAYWIVSDTELTAEEVKEQGSVLEITGGTEGSIAITGLTGNEHTVYVVLEDAAGNLSDVKKETLTTQHEAPEILPENLDIDYSSGTITLPADIIGQVEVYTDPSDPEGSKITPNADGTLPVEPGTTIYIRYPEEDGTPASEATEIQIPDRPAAPEEKQVTVTSSTITVADPSPDEEYVLVEKGQEPDWSNANTTGEFTGLTPDKEYDLYVRTKATENSFASEPVKTEITAHDHTPSADWLHDADHHWHECGICGEELDKTAHTSSGAATEDTAETCTECGYVIAPATGHITHTADTSKWLSDGTNHWHKCAGCDEKLDIAAHSGGTATCTDKALCEVCGAAHGDVDSTNHTDVATEWSKDETGHWHECNDCGAKLDKTAHTSSGAASEDTAETCTECGYVITPATGHITHTADTSKWLSDGTNHWHKCVGCNEKLDIAAHSGGTATCTDKALCEVCGAAHGDVDSTNHTNIAAEWSKDETGHWHECNDCGAELDKTAHTSSGAAAPDKAENCTVCGYEIAPATGYVTDPTFTPASGSTFTSREEVSIACATEGAEIYYTTDGTDPTTASTKYEGAFTISRTTTVKAIAVKDGMGDSKVVSATFTKKSSGSGSYRPSRPSYPGNPAPENPTPENPAPENPNPENPAPENPNPENPAPENPSIDNVELSEDEIVTRIDDLPDGGELTIDMNGNTTVSAEVKEAIENKDAVITFVVDTDISIVVDGSEIVDNSSEIDLSVGTSNTTLSVTNFSAIGGTAGKQFTLGDVGVNAKVDIASDKTNAGMFASLMKLDQETGKYEFVSVSKIGADGRVLLDTNGKGDHLMIIDSETKKPGDLNNDMLANAMDAAELLKSIVYELSLNGFKADYNGDGKIDALDAAEILKVVVGLVPDRFNLFA